MNILAQIDPVAVKWFVVSFFTAIALALLNSR